MAELGNVNGKPLSVKQVWERGGGGEAGEWSYETVRKIVHFGHQAIGDKIADTLATALDLPVSDVLRAAGQRPRLGRFVLPKRADRLTQSERVAVLTVIDAILAADKEERG
ncbi:hypothetical protein D1871_11325 [Nakamurella silvestris]|nr:hypothetical protein D1871_11325 [Nakamurella silvestris]